MKTALLCVSFGTSVPAARKSIDAVEKALYQQMPYADFYRAFTSPTIRRILAGRGENIWSMEEALDNLICEDYDRIVIQPTHFLYGLEYEALRSEVEEAKKKFPNLILGEPLLSCTQDLKDLAQILCEEYPARKGEAVVFMGHGTPHFSNVVYPALQAVFHMMGRKDVFVGTVEGWPEIDQIAFQLKDGSFSGVRLAPLMLVAGDHALNDMAGEENDSWKNILSRKGFQVECILKGLGVNQGVQDLYQKHLGELLEAQKEESLSIV